MVTFRRSTRLATLVALTITALTLVGCGSSPGAANPSGAASPLGATSPPGAPGTIHLHISEAFDDRATEENMWNSGTIAADGAVTAAKLDSMDLGVIYDGNQIGPAPWEATTQQDSGDFEGECNGGDDCRPCTGHYGGSWPIDSVDFTVQERGGGRYVIELWLGSEIPPKTGGCDPMVGNPVAWASNMTVTLTGIGTATPQATAVGSEGNTAVYEIQVTQ